MGRLYHIFASPVSTNKIRDHLELVKMVKTSVVATCVCAILAASTVGAFHAPSATRSICSRVTARNAMTMRWGLEAKGVANKVARYLSFSKRNLSRFPSFSSSTL